MIKLEYCNNCVHEKCRTDQGRYESQLIPMFIETPCIYIWVYLPPVLQRLISLPCSEDRITLNYVFST